MLLDQEVSTGTRSVPIFLTASFQPHYARENIVSKFRIEGGARLEGEPKEEFETLLLSGSLLTVGHHAIVRAIRSEASAYVRL